ncbi:MAG: DMT family transporter [Bauldia sp.]|nr:DMT family transporter [Bauldia sp.]
MDPPEHARPLVGIALKVASTLSFTAMATLIKLDSARYPIGELVCFRSFFALIPVLAWVMWRGQFPSVFYTQRIGRHFVRSVSGAVTMFLGFTALSLLPIADATAIGYAAPLMTVVLAVIFLGEKVRIYRWSAVIIGLIGVLVILSDYVGPDVEGGATERSAFGAIIAVSGAFLGAVTSTQVRAMVRYEGAATIVVYFSLFTSLFALVTLPFGWVMPDLPGLLSLVAAGIFGGMGQVLMTQSFRYGGASMIAPFDYTSMIWALTVSLLVFDTWPSQRMLLGTAIVIGAGLFVIFRERRLGIERARSKRAQTPTTPLT